MPPLAAPLSINDYNEAKGRRWWRAPLSNGLSRIVLGDRDSCIAITRFNHTDCPYHMSSHTLHTHTSGLSGNADPYRSRISRT